MFKSTKTYGHERGLSCSFRQWKADSHCKYIHGYALGFKFIFQSFDLDARNWVVDFGSLKSVEAMLKDMFDHKYVVANDDPEKEYFLDLQNRGLAQVRWLPAVGCEAFAYFVAKATQVWLIDSGYGYAEPGKTPRVKLHSVEVFEHGANSSIFEPDDYHDKYPPFDLGE